MKKRVFVALRPRKKKKELFCLQKFWFGGGVPRSLSLSKTTVARKKWKVDRAKVSEFVRTGKGGGQSRGEKNQPKTLKKPARALSLLVLLPPPRRGNTPAQTGAATVQCPKFRFS